MVRPGRKPEDSIPTSSMADVAFLLLIFFLVTTVFPKDKGLALVLPEEIREVDAANVLHLLVRGDGSVEVRVGTNPGSRVIDASEVARTWRIAVSARAFLIAAVKTGATVPYARMIDVLDQLHAANATRISLQSLEGGGS